MHEGWKEPVRLKNTRKASFFDCIKWGCGEIISDTSLEGGAGRSLRGCQLLS